VFEKVLALDMSTKTGWSLFHNMMDDVGLQLIEYGQLEQIHTPKGDYPGSFLVWADQVFEQVANLVDRVNPDVIVIEETSAGSKAIYTQKILEWIHYLFAEFVVDRGTRIVYIMTEEWRRETGCSMSKEEKKRNAQVSKLKSKQRKEILADESLTKEERDALLKKVRAKVDGKIVGRTGRKHVNIRRANEVFGSYFKEPLRKRDEDLADSLMLGFCYHLRSLKSA
jgi:hypothetical protein